VSLACSNVHWLNAVWHVVHPAKRALHIAHPSCNFLPSGVLGSGGAGRVTMPLATLPKPVSTGEPEQAIAKPEAMAIAKPTDRMLRDVTMGPLAS
jgi:hypothetical protein